MKWIKNLNTPNKITLFRVLCVFIEFILMILDYFLFYKTNLYKTEIIYSWTRITMFIIFIIASISDKIDGDLARKNNQVTNLGKFLDPIADKLLYNTLIIYFAVIQDILFVVPLIYIIRDTIVDGVRMMAAKHNVVIPASVMGKAKTVSQVIAQFSIFILSPISTNLWALIIVYIFVGISCLLSIISGIEYLSKNTKVLEG